MSRTAGREILEALRFFGPLRRQISRLMPDDVGPGGLTALRVIGTADALGEQARVSDVAAAQHVGLPVASRQVRQLEDRGLLTRAVSPDDRRAHLLTLTDDGHQLLRRIETELTGLIDGVLADWPTEDAVQLARLMARLHDGFSRIETIHPGAGPTDTAPDDSDAPTLQETSA